MQRFMSTLIFLIMLTSPVYAASPLLDHDLTPMEVDKFYESGASADDEFGYCIAADGDTMVIGAPNRNYNGINGKGVALVYEYDPSNGKFLFTSWLTANPLPPSTRFAEGVAISGDTIAVSFPHAKKLYIYEKPAGGWALETTQTATLYPLDDESDTSFAGKDMLAIDGDTIVASCKNTSVGDAAVQKAYIFEKPAGGWLAENTQTAILTPSDGSSTPNYKFGSSVAIGGGDGISGRYVTVAAPEYTSDSIAQRGKVYKYSKPSSGWEDMTETSSISGTSSQQYFGTTIAQDSESSKIAVADANQHVYIYSHTTREATLTASDSEQYDGFGGTGDIAFSGDTILIGAPGADGAASNSGAVYLFEKTGASWSDMTEDKIFTVSGAFDQGYSGKSIAIAGTDFFINNYMESPSGAVYHFGKTLQLSGREGETEIIDLAATDPEGETVTFSINGSDTGNLLVNNLSGKLNFIEAPDYETPGDNNGDNIYEATVILEDSSSDTSHYPMRIRVYNSEHEGDSLIPEKAKNLQQIYHNGDSNRFYGRSVAQGDNFIAVGIPGDSRVYIYTKNAEGTSNEWEAVLAPPVLNNADYIEFGKTVAISGDTIVVGADRTSDIGAAFVFEKPVGNWIDANATIELSESIPDDGSDFGSSVAISGDTIAVGASSADNKGAVFVYEKPDTGWVSMTETAQLSASDGTSLDSLGYSVAVDGDTIAAGAIGWEYNVSSYDTGAVYVYERPVSGWINMTETAQLSAYENFHSADMLGYAVAISGDRIIAGAPGEAEGRPGYACLFNKPQSGWQNGYPNATLSALDGPADDHFGRSVSFSNTTIAVGAEAAVYLFAGPWPSGSITENKKLTTASEQPGDNFGRSVSLRGKAMVVGADWYGTPLNPKMGSMHIFIEENNSSIVPMLMLLLD